MLLAAQLASIAYRHPGNAAPILASMGFVLLADDALRHAPAGGRRKLVVTTLVSSTLLSRMARDRGAAYAETLTGFKYIGQKVCQFEAEGKPGAPSKTYLFGAEESYGYMPATYTRDRLMRWKIGCSRSH